MSAQAIAKIFDLQGRRSHSEKELRAKLSKFFSKEEIEEALLYAKDHRLIDDPQELSERVAEGLRRKGKGIRFVNGYLAQKGLPPVKNNDQEEIEVASTLLSKLKGRSKSKNGDKQKWALMLARRGFSPQAIHQVIGKVIGQQQEIDQTID